MQSTETHLTTSLRDFCHNFSQWEPVADELGGSLLITKSKVFNFNPVIGLFTLIEDAGSEPIGLSVLDLRELTVSVAEMRTPQMKHAIELSRELNKPVFISKSGRLVGKLQLFDLALPVYACDVEPQIEETRHTPSITELRTLSKQLNKERKKKALELIGQ